jgi:hypothetical protein
MGFNKKVLSKAVSELDKAKAPAKPRDITVDPMGYWNPANQGQPVRVPGNDITMHNVKAPVWAQPNVGPGVLMEPEKNYNFKDASYVDETPMAKKGGTAGKLSNDNGLVTKVVPMKFDLPELKGAEKINDKVTLAMSPDSTGLYKIGKDIEKFCGIPEADVIRDVKAGKDKPEDAIIYGMSNIMNGGKDIYLWINATRLQGSAKEKGVDAAIMEIVSHESLHITRKLLTRAIAKSKGVSVDNEDWVKHDYGDGEYMWPAIGDVSEKHPIVQIDEEAFATAEGYVTERILPHFLEMAKKYLDINKDKVFKKGGTLQSKKYSSSISATNKLFTKNKLFKNMKSKIFDPNSKFKSGGSKLGSINLNPNPLSHYELNYGFNLPTKQDGGENEDEYMDLTDEEIQAYREAGYEVDEEPEYEIGGYVQHELVKAQKGKTVKTFKRDVRDQDAQSNTGWSSAPVQQKKVSTNKKIPTTLKEKLNQTPQQAFDNDFKVVTAKENAVLKEKNREQNNTFKNQQMPGYKDYGPQSAGSADWFWTLPIAGPAALEAASSIGAMSLPGLSSVPGATVGNLFNASTIAEGINQTPETIKAWNDVAKGKKNWSDAALETGINLSEFIGSGSGVKSLAQDVNQGAKYLNKGIKTASNYGKDLAYSSKQAGKLKFPTYQPVSRWDPEHVPYSLQQAGRDLTPEQQALTGSWYSYKPKGVNDYEHTIGFYPTNRPGPGTLKHLRLSEREIANLENSMSDAAKGMSGKSESVTTSSDYLKGELNLPQYLRNKTKSVKFDVNPSEYIPQSHGAEPRSSFGMGQTGQHIADVLRSQYPKLAGIPRQYLPFKDGGAIHEIWEDELDEHTIALLRRAGYTVEELD